MSDEAPKAQFRYRNKNTGQVVEYDRQSPRLEYLQNWETITAHGQDAPGLDEGDGRPRSGRGNLIGSSNVGDRAEDRHQVPPGTFQPEIEYTEPSTNQLRGNHPPAEDFHTEKQPEVVTVDPSQQVRPKTGEDKRDLSVTTLDSNLDLNPISKPIGSNAEDGVLARANPGAEAEENRRQELIAERQNGRGIDPADRPARSASKADWVNWAVKCGAEREDAEAMTKTDLVDVYGE